jgi:hypothetical protein
MVSRLVDLHSRGPSSRIAQATDVGSDGSVQSSARTIKQDRDSNGKIEQLAWLCQL